jgi:hypothetical protein
MGIVFVQNITMLEVWQSILTTLQGITHTDSYAVNFTVTFFIAMALPVTLFGAAAWVAKRFNGDSLAGNFAKFGYAIIPLDIAGHIAHNLFHLLAEGKAVLFTSQALFGQAVSGGSPALLPIPTIQALQYVLIVVGAGASLYAAYAIGKSHYRQTRTWAALASYAVLIAILFAINMALFALPMAMRM